jgi:hypothetical protein
MKRNVSLLVLACEILAIVVLHAVKINHVSTKTEDQNKSISKVTTLDQQVRPFQLVSLK